jgi:hypothetical protein
MPNKDDYEGMISEIRAGEVLMPKDDKDLAWNNASERSIRIIENYKNGIGIFQLARK